MSSSQSSKKNETTLTHLTKRFVKLLNSNQERIINLNEASTRLSVAKRRIYDITNVLEGIGLLQKTSKNLTRWVDCPRESPFAAPPTTDQNDPTDNELSALMNTYQKLEEGIKELEATIAQQMNAEGAFVTYQDFKSSFDDQTIIAVKAPPETWLEVNEHQQIAIKSEPGQKIEVYLYQQSPNAGAPTSHQLPSQTQPSSINPQPLDATFTNTNNLIGAHHHQPQPYTSVASDEGRGISATTSGVSETDHYFDDPTLSSALSGMPLSEDEDPFKPLVPYDGREEPHYNFVLNDDYPITSLFPEDNLGLI